MARSQETYNKKEVRNKKEKKRKDKEKKRLDRKANSKGSSGFDDMIAYVDENGRISSTPPLQKNTEIDPDDIEVAVPRRQPGEKENPIRKGVVTFFDDSKGFGFIKDIANQNSIFVHANGLIDRIKEKDKVEFLIEPGNRGPMATNVKLVN
jgi:cold shock CspA family protein